MERPDGWVFIVASRGARRALARADRLNGSVGHATAGAVAAPGPGEETGQGLTEGGLLDGLTPRERLAVLLRFHEDLTLADVAQAMGCRVGTVKATLHSALNKLRAQLGVSVDDAVEQLEEEP
jgi:DNA-directed RNA polymerase specialized sigma24 family protein